jgi:hypothetical protein
VSVPSVICWVITLCGQERSGSVAGYRLHLQDSILNRSNKPAVVDSHTMTFGAEPFVFSSAAKKLKHRNIQEQGVEEDIWTEEG